MLDKEKLLIYPFSAQFCPILRHLMFMNAYEISQVVSPVGWGMSGSDVCIADGGEKTGILVTENFYEALGMCETALFVDSNYKMDFNKSIFPKILKAIEARKNIIVLLDIDCVTKEKISNACNEFGVYFKYYGTQNEKIPDYRITRDNLLKIETPVIFVLGLAENMNKFEIQICMREALIKAGYKISQIGTRTYSEMLGMHHFPGFMLNSSIPESTKIVMFNRFIREMELNEKPEVIVVGIPGGIIPFNNEFTNRFGILAFEVSMALKPDTAVLSIPFGDYNDENYNKIVDIVKHRLGFDIDAINLSNILPDWLKINQGLDMSFVTVGNDLVNSKKKAVINSIVPVFNILDRQDSIKLVNSLIDKLSGYGQIEVV